MNETDTDDLANIPTACRSKPADRASEKDYLIRPAYRLKGTAVPQ